MKYYKKRICFIATIEMVVKAFLLEHIKMLNRQYDVCVIVRTDDKDFLRPHGINIPVIFVDIKRKISLWNDLKALLSLFKLFRQQRFDVVHSIMPKSGLLSMAAGLFARVPKRIHTFTGQVWVSRTGLKRFLLKSLDKCIVAFATDILVDSYSQRDFLVAEGVISRERATVLAKGSIAGVDLQRFRSNPEARAVLRRQLGIHETEIVFLFLGRLNRDKGILDLARAFTNLCSTYQNIHLLIVGPDEEGMRARMMDISNEFGSRMHYHGYTDEPEVFIAASDVLCLPSYREGFGTVIIEAAAAGIPAIGTRIYGITDAIVEGVTGHLYEAGNINDLAAKMIKFIENPSLRQRMGENARQRVLNYFSKEDVTMAMLKYYECLLHETE